MATIDDIDTQAAVRKFLERQVVVNREDEAADSADEVRAILEACALAFLLNPQAALCFILLAKNTLQQILEADVKILDYLTKAVDDINNPNEPLSDTSDLVEAGTALVEVDRIGRVASDVKSYDRYIAAVNRFLDRRLAKSLKRRRRQEFERSGVEARQDLFRVLAAFEPVHSVMAERLRLLVGSVDDFDSFDLTTVVAPKTVARVRASLKKLLAGISQKVLSKTAIALELLAGAAAMKSISKTKNLYDPLVDTGTFPTGRTVQISSEEVAAVSAGAAAPDLFALPTPWSFTLAVDGGGPATVLFPSPSVSGQPFVLSASSPAGFTISPSAKTLYVELAGITPPAGQATYVQAVVLPTGLQTLSALQAAISAAYPAALGCEVLGSRLLIFGNGAATGIKILTQVPGTFSPGWDYVAADASAHTTLGLSDDQEGEISVFRAQTVIDIIAEQVENVEAVVEDGLPVLRSLSASPSSALTFSGAVAAALGFASAVAEPSYLVLVENGVEVDPEELGVVPDSLVTASDEAGERDLRATVSRIEGTHLLFDVDDLPRCVAGDALVVSPLVHSVQTMIDAVDRDVGTFSGDARELQRVLSPLFSQTALAQINDAKTALAEIRGRVASLKARLDAIVVRPDRNDLAEVATHIIRSLEDRGLDRALDLLRQANFSEFFALSREGASRSSRFLRAVEEIGRKDFPKTSVEADTQESTVTGVTPDDDLPFGSNVLEDDGDSD